MGCIIPNPPTKEDPITTGLQALYTYTVRNENSTGVDVVSGGGASSATQAITATGTQVAFPTYSALNSTTKLQRAVRQSGAAANVNAGWGVVYNSSPGAAVFPIANGAGGFRLRMICGFDDAVGAVASTQFLSGAVSASLNIPVAGTPITNNALAWIGLYNQGAGGGLHFGFKPTGTGVITQLDTGNELAALWAPYAAWYVDIFCSPNGPRTFYSVGLLNAGGTAFAPVLVGQTVLFAPGAISFAPMHVGMPTAAGQNTNLFLLNATLVAYLAGSLSL